MAFIPVFFQVTPVTIVPCTQLFANDETLRLLVCGQAPDKLSQRPSFAESDISTDCASLSSESSAHDVRTTLVLREIPTYMTRDAFLEYLDSKGLQGCYDFFFLPWSFEEDRSLGYAIVNLIAQECAEHVMAMLQGSELWPNKLEVCWSEQQGFAANVEKYRNSSVMHKSVPEEFKPMIFDRGVCLPFPAPTKRLRQPRAMVRVSRSTQLATLKSPGDSLREGVSRIIKILNLSDMGSLFVHLTRSVAVNFTYTSPGICDELTSPSQVVAFHRRLREAVPDMHLTLESVSEYSWRAVGSGTFLEQIIPDAPIGKPVKFVLESKIKADEELKINWVRERFELVAEEPNTRSDDIQTERVARNENEVKHFSGECQPCAYFAFKSSGCAKGSSCPMCHLCTKGQARMRKRAKAFQLKLSGRAAESSTDVDAGWVTDDGF